MSLLGLLESNNFVGRWPIDSGRGTSRHLNKLISVADEDILHDDSHAQVMKTQARVGVLRKHRFTQQRNEKHKQLYEL